MPIAPYHEIHNFDKYIKSRKYRRQQIRLPEIFIISGCTEYYDRNPQTLTFYHFWRTVILQQNVTNLLAIVQTNL